MLQRGYFQYLTILVNITDRRRTVCRQRISDPGYTGACWGYVLCIESFSIGSQPVKVAQAILTSENRRFRGRRMQGMAIELSVSVTRISETFIRVCIQRVVHAKPSARVHTDLLAFLTKFKKASDGGFRWSVEETIGKIKTEQSWVSVHGINLTLK